MPHHEHTPEVLNHEATPALETAADELRVLGGLPVRGSVVLDYKRSETSNGVDVQPDEPRPEVARVESESERERRAAYEHYHEQLRIPEALRHQAMEALRRTLAACREEFVGFDEQLVAQATARLMAIIDETPLPPDLRKPQHPSASTPAGEWVVRDRIHQKLLNVRDGSMYAALNYPYDTHAIREAALEAMRHHPLYQAFEATIGESEKPASRKRTPFELQSALAQTEQEVKRRHGIAPHDDLRLHHEARRAFERQAWQIEDEEIPHTTSDKDDTHSKAFDFFVSMLPEQERSEFRRSIGLLKAGWPKKGVASNEQIDAGNRLIGQVSAGIDAYKSTSATRSEEVDFLVKRFMKSGFRKLLSQEVKSRTVASSEYQLTAGSIGGLELRERRSFYYVSSWQDVSETYAERVRQMSMGADLPSAVQYSLDARDYGFESEPSQAVLGSGVGSLSGHNFYTESSLSESANYDMTSLEAQPPLAAVHYTDAFPFSVPQAMRLIQPASMPDMSDVSRVRNHMVIEPKNNFLPTADNAFTVAGFKLEWASNGRLHFAYDANHDPYTPARVPLPEGSIDQLIAVYKEAGLDELACLVDQGSIRTVDQLVRTLAQGADYAQRGNGTRITTKTLGDLAEAYKDEEGRLNYQCSGAAQLLKLSLQELYGENSVSVITGSVLPPGSDTIGAVGHAQVKFESPDDGCVYYLDATPAGGTPAMTTSMAQESRVADEVISSKPPVVEKNVKWLEAAEALFEEEKRRKDAVGEIREYTKIEADEAVIALREAKLLPLAGAWLGIRPAGKKSRDELYRKLLDLQKGDPLRSTLELTHQIPAGTAKISQLPRLKALLDTIRHHPVNSPLFKRIRHYSRPQLDALSDIVGEVEAVYAGVASTTED